MPIDAVVADANVLLSAAVGKAALRVITEHWLTAPKGDDERDAVVLEQYED